MLEFFSQLGATVSIIAGAQDLRIHIFVNSFKIEEYIGISRELLGPRGLHLTPSTQKGKISLSSDLQKMEKTRSYMFI